MCDISSKKNYITCDICSKKEDTVRIVVFIIKEEEEERYLTRDHRPNGEAINHKLSRSQHYSLFGHIL